MQTRTTVQRDVSRSDSKLDTHLSDAASEFLVLAQSLTPEQARALNQVVSPLDRTTGPVRIGLFSPRQADRNTLVEYLVRPVASRKVRTPEHRKVVALRIDASSLPVGMQPWHNLIMSVIELLSESALPTERATLSELRNEISRLIRTSQREPAAAQQPAIAFVRRFQASFPKLVLNTVSLANSVLLIVLDRVDEVEPKDTAQWLEASKYFCGVPGCSILLTASEPALIAKLNLSEENVNGRELLSAWVTRRVEFPPPPVIAHAIVSPVHETSTAPAGRDKTAGIARQNDVPMACANVIRDALQPDVTAIVNSTAQWRLAMHAVVRRSEEGLGGSISGTLIAKLVALRAVAPTLYDAARYDAQLLPSLERAAHGDSSSDSYDEWISQVAQHPRLAGIFAADPSFASVDLRDLATALRLTNSGDETAISKAASEVTVGDGNGSAVVGAMESAGAVAHSLLAAAQAAEDRFFVSPALVATAVSGAGVFFFDRIVKLIIQTALQQSGAVLMGGFIKPEFLPPGGSVWSGGLGVGTEFFGLALAILIAWFWGSTRKESDHAISLGLIIGALASNLFDRLAYGSVLNYFHLANLPVFNLSHVALLLGALLLAITLLRGPQSDTGVAIGRR
jgi:lipoprotein signal peptidase